MKDGDLQRRTRLYALRVIDLVELLPRGRSADVIGNQLLRCATSVGANYRAACRPRSSADFIAKLGIVEEEADESLYWLDLLAESGLIWLDLLAESGLIPRERLTDLMTEADEILAMTVASIRTAKSRRS